MKKRGSHKIANKLHYNVAGISILVNKITRNANFLKMDSAVIVL